MSVDVEKSRFKFTLSRFVRKPSRDPALPSFSRTSSVVEVDPQRLRRAASAVKGRAKEDKQAQANAGERRSGSKRTSKRASKGLAANAVAGLLPSIVSKPLHTHTHTTDEEPEMVMSMRRKSYYVPVRSVTSAAVYSLSATVMLALVFALELRYPDELLFSTRSTWRLPFLSVCVLSWALLLFGFLIQCTIRAVGRRRGHVLSLPPAARCATVLGLAWVCAGMVSTAVAFVFVFLGMQDRAELRRRVDPIQRWAMPVLVGLLPAFIFAILALVCLVYAARAVRTVKAPPSTRSRSRSRGGRSRGSRSRSQSRSREGLAVHMRPEGNYESWDRLDANRRLPPSTTLPTPPPPTAPPADSAVQLSREEIEERLAKLRDMGFGDDEQNYQALYRSNFVVTVAAQRLLDAVQYR